MPTNMYDQDQMRYESARLERLNPSLQNNYGYDISGSQTWNPNGFANAQTLGGIRSASASLKPNTRGRTGLPTVSREIPSSFPSPLVVNINTLQRRGWINSRT